MWNYKAYTLGNVLLKAGIIMAVVAIPTVSTALNFESGLHFIQAVPSGTFGDNINRDAYGVNLEGVVKPANSPVGFGLGLGFVNYGYDTRTEPFSYNIPDIRVDVSNSNNIFFSNVFVRFQPYNGVITPYIDGILGFNYLITSSSVHGEEYGHMSSTNFDDAALSYGVGFGVKVRLHEFENKGRIFKLSVDFRVRQMKGGNAKYLREGSIIRQDGDVSYESYESDTDMALYQLGLNFAF